MCIVSDVKRVESGKRQLCESKNITIQKILSLFFRSMYNSDMYTANPDGYLPLHLYISIAFLSVSSKPTSASCNSSRFIHSYGFTRNTKTQPNQPNKQTKEVHLLFSRVTKHFKCMKSNKQMLCRTNERKICIYFSG